MTVIIAVTNRASIWVPNSVPRIAKMPTTTMTSWSRATRAAAPNLMLWNRMPIQIRMPREPRRISRMACWMSWALTTGPTVFSSPVQVSGPSLGSACMAVASLPRAPTAGTDKVHVSLPFWCVLAMAPGGNVAEGLAPGAADAEAPGAADAEAPGAADAEAPGAADAEAPGAADAEAPGAADGLALAAGLALA